MGVGSQHFSSSAKTGQGVNEIFRILSEKIIECKKNKKVEEPKTNATVSVLASMNSTVCVLGLI